MSRSSMPLASQQRSSFMCRKVPLLLICVGLLLTCSLALTMNTPSAQRDVEPIRARESGSPQTRRDGSLDLRRRLERRREKHRGAEPDVGELSGHLEHVRALNNEKPRHKSLLHIARLPDKREGSDVEQHDLDAKLQQDDDVSSSEPESDAESSGWTETDTVLLVLVVILAIGVCVSFACGWHIHKRKAASQEQRHQIWQAEMELAGGPITALTRSDRGGGAHH